MKPYERRAAGAYPYFLLAVWNERLQCFQDGKRSFPSYIQAQSSAKRAGRYRTSEIPERGARKDHTPFDIK